ncbi:cysteinyl leukotriene receptor 1-like [Tubulanus polymorphus]|uniref:cysteinyl leukotriene receptor 1-like n=1 Tax=Tubulanus polymorphus TaxID=672921 RepID=UPI003DA53B8A
MDRTHVNATITNATETTVSDISSSTTTTAAGLVEDLMTPLWIGLIEKFPFSIANRADRWYIVICYTIINLLGFLGNPVILIIMTSTRLRRHAHSVYLGALAVADFVALLPRLLSLINQYSVLGTTDHVILISIESKYACKVSEYVYFSAAIYSSWMVAVVSVERFIVVRFPFLGLRVCTVTKARVVALVFLVSIFASSSFIFVFVDYDQRHGCFYTKRHHFVRTVYGNPMISYGPGLIVLAFNVVTLVYIRRSRDRVQSGSSVKSRRLRKATAMLLTLSISFLLLTGPLAITVFLILIYPKWRPWLSVPMDYLHIVRSLNYALNLVIYLLTGEEFRRVFLGAFVCSRKQATSSGDSINAEPNRCKSSPQDPTATCVRPDYKNST